MKAGRALSTAFAGGDYAFLYLPIAVLVVYSFNRDGVGGIPSAETNGPGDQASQKGLAAHG